ncbi:MAG: GHMP family kinase ATP-binding protein [Candidatus Zipacnadales bacterium]
MMRSHAPDLHDRAQRLITKVAEFARVPCEQVRVVRSPYRICPLGAHVDHQLGRVTGMALDRCVLLAFASTDDQRVRIRSHDFDGEIDFPLAAPLDVPQESWGRYVAGAVRALREWPERPNELTRGITGIIEGDLPFGGLSSSAAVSIAYLLALETANDLLVSHEDNIHLEQYIENVHIGLNNGILDQSVILLSRADALLFLDCLYETWELVPRPPTMPDFGIVIAYSGLSQALTGTGYNRRVAECQEAARQLLQLGGSPDVTALSTPTLRAVPMEQYQALVDELPPHLAKRARHYFTENVRVIAGRYLWTQGNLKRFGELIKASGQSSIENYECGRPELITLYEILNATDGVYGARFSGGGFRGSCIGLYEPGAEETIHAAIAELYPQRHPHVAHSYAVYFCQSDAGATLL